MFKSSNKKIISRKKHEASLFINFLIKTSTVFYNDKNLNFILNLSTSNLWKFLFVEYSYNVLRLF